MSVPEPPRCAYCADPLDTADAVLVEMADGSTLQASPREFAGFVSGGLVVRALHPRCAPYAELYGAVAR